MSRRLRERVKAKVLKLGKNGAEKLAEQSGFSVSTIREAKLRGQVSPSTGYALALACEASEEEALSIADELSPEAKKAG